MCYRRTDALTTVWIHFYSHVLVTHGQVRFPKPVLDFPDPKSRARVWDTIQPRSGTQMYHHLLSTTDSSIINRTTNRTTTTMAPNLGLHKRILIQSIIDSKLQGNDAPKDDEIAEIANYTARVVRHI